MQVWIKASNLLYFTPHPRIQHDPLHAAAEAGSVTLVLLSGRPAGAEPWFLSTGEKLHLGRCGQLGDEVEDRVEYDLHHGCGVQSHRCVYCVNVSLSPSALKKDTVGVLPPVLSSLGVQSVDTL